MSSIKRVETRKGSSADLRVRADRVAGSLTRSLAKLVASLTQGSGKPSALVERAKLDKSLASRVVRGLRTPPDASALAELPSPKGLRKVLESARKSAPRELLAELERDIQAYESFAAEFSGGRPEMLAVVSDWLPDARASAERTARQRLHTAWADVAGKREAARLLAIAIAPSAAGDTCDRLAVSMIRGLRRLRGSAPMTLTGVDTRGPLGQVRSLDGRPAAEVPRALAVEAFCSPMTEKLRVLDDGRQLTLYLPGGEPPINTPVDLAFARLSLGAWRRRATAQQPEEFENSRVRFPVGRYVSDLLLHEDVGTPEPPVISTSLTGLAPPRGPRDAVENEVQRIDLHVEIEKLPPLDASLSQLRADEAPSYPDLVRYALHKAGWEASRFRAYRISLEYPTPFVWYSWWVPLPEESAAREP